MVRGFVPKTDGTPKRSSYCVIESKTTRIKLLQNGLWSQLEPTASSITMSDRTKTGRCLSSRFVLSVSNTLDGLPG
jgi:hypothetical protein